MNTIAEQKKRLEWLDAMRGFTMLLVVAHHIMSFTFRIHSTTPYPEQTVMLIFRMPLFFFVSGFLAYSARTEWNARTLGQNLLKKTRIQLLPTLVFLMLFEAIIRKDFGASFMKALSLPLKDGFWFTWALLLMFFAYYPFAYIEAKLKKWLPGMPSWLPICMLWVIGFGMYLTHSFPKTFDYTTTWCKYTSIGQPIKFFVFFVTGNICRRYWTKAEHLFDSKWLFPLAMTAAIISCTDLTHWHVMQDNWKVFPRVFSVFSLLIIVISFFRHNAETLSKQTVVGRVMQYVGTRTLDIYLLHFFFLPNWPKLGKWIQETRPGALVDIVITFAMAGLVIAISLFASAVLRTSPVLRKYLFGQKQ